MLKKCTKCLLKLDIGKFYEGYACCKKCHGIATKRSSRAFFERKAALIRSLGGKCRCGNTRFHSLVIRTRSGIKSITCKACQRKNHKATKKCNKCGRSLRLTQFHKKDASNDGRAPTCIKCSLKYVHTRAHIKHVQYVADKNRLRGTILQYYGDKCVVCGEKHPDFLAIDHTTSNGGEQRRKHNMRGLRLYRWIVKNSFPKDLRLLCHNCNIKMHFSAHRRSEYHALMKANVMYHYGDGKCVCCGADDMDVLSVDHIHGNGAADRKKCGGGGSHFYRLLIKRHYPPGYQVMCFNCNFSKHIRGTCCHNLA